jgi:SAM-dependent methyltransferase
MVNPVTVTIREETQRIWDRASADFDEEPDHGMRDPHIRDAWRNQIRRWLLYGSPAGLSVLDIGCGTGSLSVLLSSRGHDVTGLDISPAMLTLAREKSTAAGFCIPFHVMDAANPSFGPRRFDVIICRHVLWTLPDLALVLRRWADLLKPGGELVLVEGYWFTDAGLRCAEVVEALPPSLTLISTENLTDRTDLWGKAVSDERYAVRAILENQEDLS